MQMDPRVDRFFRSDKVRDVVDTDKYGRPAGFEQSVDTNGTVTFTFLNNGEPITYEILPNRQPRPTSGYANRTIDTLKKGKSDAPAAVPATNNNSGPKGERQRKPVSSDNITQPSSQSEPAETNTAEPKATYFEQYLRLVRKLIEG